MNQHFQHLVDHNGRSLLTFTAISVWMGLVIEVVGLLWILGTLLFAYFTTLHHANLSETALAVTSTLPNLGCLQLLFIIFAELQTSMASVQRMQHYSRLNQERDTLLPSDDKLPSGWPLKGAIRFEKVTLRYREDFPPALKDLHFTIEPKMKVGVVGRTGAGKSSLI